MSRIVILGAGIAGHTVARYLNKWVGKQHEIIVVSPNSKWNWIPSNIWVGVGQMTEEQVTFDLAQIYKKTNVDFRQAKAISIHPEGKDGNTTPFVTVEYTKLGKVGVQENIPYDFLVNATGPKLNFAATEGLGPDHGHTVSVCTFGHAQEANHQLQANIDAMRKGENRTFVIGTGHGMCTCQGAAFEYIYNVDHVLREAGVRDKAIIIWISNEYELGDFGMGGVHINRGGYVTNGKVFAESLMVERDIQWITRAHVKKVEAGKIHYETLDGTFHELAFDFSMLIAMSIRDMLNGAEKPTHTASMAEMGAACVASTGSHIFKGTAATMTVFPVVPDYEKYPEYGRDMDLTFGEIGLAGHWMKYLLHHAFIYQAKLRLGWSILPD